MRWGRWGGDATFGVICKHISGQDTFFSSEVWEKVQLLILSQNHQ